MSREEVYPWATLTQVGDYFLVTEEFRPNCHYFMNATVAQRNKYYKGRAKYTCVKTTYGCIVMLVQVGEDMPGYDYAVMGGVFASAKRFDHTATQPLGNRPKARELSQYEKIQRMSQPGRVDNLPWWYDGGKLVWNNNGAKRPEDLDAWLNNRFPFGPNDPYPEFYMLDENLIKRAEPVLDNDPVDEDEDEDFGGEPIYVEDDSVDG